MRHLAGLRSLALIAAVFSAVMLVLWLADSEGSAELLVPSPEMTAEQFVGALAAHRYTGAAAQMGESQRRDVGEDRLRDLVRAIEQQRGGIREAHGRASQIEGGTATATVAVQTGDGRDQEVRFPLRKELGVWKLTDIGPLASLASR